MLVIELDTDKNTVIELTYLNLGVHNVNETAENDDEVKHVPGVSEIVLF